MHILKSERLLKFHFIMSFISFIFLKMPILFYFLNEIHFSFSTDTFSFPSALILISHFFHFLFGLDISLNIFAVF